MPATTLAPELKRSMELYDDSYESLESEPRIPRRIRIPKQPRIGNDGNWVTPDSLFGKEETIGNDGCWVNPGRVFGALPNGEETTGGFFDRWRAYRKMVKKDYPFVRWKDFHNVWKMPVNYLFSELFGYVSDNVIPKDGRDTIPKIILGGWSDTLHFTTKTKFQTLAFEIFPRIRAMSAFSDSTTDIEKSYNYITASGYELPVFLNKRGIPKPNDSDFVRNARFIEKWGISPYNKVEKSGNAFISDYFKRYGVNKYSRNDYSKYFAEQPRKFHRWMMKDDTHLITQYGNRDHLAETEFNSLISSQGIPGEIRVYQEPIQTSGFWYNIGKLIGDKSPSSWRAWWYWQLGDWAYDIVDIGFGPAESILRRTKVPPQAIRDIMDGEYKVAAAIRRGLQPGRGVNFTYELPNRTIYQIRRAAQEAAGFGYD